jgi:hypothetical protein
MSKYTTQVRFICETYADKSESLGADSVDEIINSSWDKIFDFDFPIFDTNYKSVLCRKILMHYYTREIGFETVGLWKLKLKTKLNEVMPYFNKLYLSDEFEFNPLIDTDYTREHSGSGEGNGNRIDSEHNTSDETQNLDGTRYDVYSDTPQGSLQNVESGEYLTDARKVTTDNTATTENASTRNLMSQTGYHNTDEYIDHIKGKMGSASYSKLLKEYRDNIINVDMMVIDSLKSLFMLVW